MRRLSLHTKVTPPFCYAIEAYNLREQDSIGNRALYGKPNIVCVGSQLRVLAL